MAIYMSITPEWGLGRGLGQYLWDFEPGIFDIGCFKQTKCLLSTTFL